ncbi:retron Ec48 family effector membrane protein, partial [Cronobacter turicensis]|nr:retron Ec48 family effector membrane protein [Cronobacter turicensis]
MSKDNGMKYFIFFIAIISFVFIFVLFFSLTSTIISQDMYKLDLCIQSKCIDHFSEKIKGVIALAQAFGWFIALVATIGGVIVALRTYRSGIDNSNITN